MSLSINDVTSKYMYTNSKTGQTRLNLDTSADGVWSEREVKNYAADYEAVTGKAIDVGAVFDTYDADKSGTLDYSEYDKLLSDDALGTADLVALQEAADAALGEITSKDEDGNNAALEDWMSSLDLDPSKVAELIGGEETEAAEETEAEGETEETEDTSESTSLSDYMASLPDAKRLSWIKSTFYAESTTNLINSMLNPGAALSNLTSLLSQYGSAGLQSSLGSSLDTEA